MSPAPKCQLVVDFQCQAVILCHLLALQHTFFTYTQTADSCHVSNYFSMCVSVHKCRIDVSLYYYKLIL